MTHYGEVHTRDAWETDRNHYGGDYEQSIPIALIIFGDKSHFDKHGSLSTTPICFTLSCFNQSTRNKVDFWRPIAYLPNLNHGVVESQTTTSTDSVQDEHNCISVALESLINIGKQGGISFNLKGKAVIGKVWIHYIIGDIQGNNRWLGHFNGTGKLKMPYRDCKCGYCNMANPNPCCVFITQHDVDVAKSEKAKARSQTKKEEAMQNISKQDIDNAFMKGGVPLSDLTHGIYRMFPPELLHTTSEGITEYMIATLGKMIGSNTLGERIKEKIGLLHMKLYDDMKRKSERDFPLGAKRTSILKNTKVGASERRGNLFILLCISCTDSAQDWLVPTLLEHNINPTDYLDCLKLYLAMEVWFHANNLIDEVQHARPLIAHVIGLVQRVFPRSDGQGWHLPKHMV